MLVEVPGVQLDFMYAVCSGGIRYAPKQSSGDTATLELGMHADLINLVPLTLMTEDVLWAELLPNQNVSSRFVSDVAEPHPRRSFPQNDAEPLLETAKVGLLEYVWPLSRM